MDTDLARLVRLHRPRRETESANHLIVCSLCLRVHRDSGWVAAEEVIKEIRSYELAALPELRSAVCEDCSDSILARRTEAREAAAA